MSFCEQCGALLGNESKFCGSCGANATTGQPVAAATAAGSISSESVATSSGLPASSIAGTQTPTMTPNIAALLRYAGLLLFLIGLADCLWLKHTSAACLKFQASETLQFNLLIDNHRDNRNPLLRGAYCEESLPTTPGNQRYANWSQLCKQRIRR